MQGAFHQVKEVVLSLENGVLFSKAEAGVFMIFETEVWFGGEHRPWRTGHEQFFFSKREVRYCRFPTGSLWKFTVNRSKYLVCAGENPTWQSCVLMVKSPAVSNRSRTVCVYSVHDFITLFYRNWRVVTVDAVALTPFPHNTADFFVWTNSAFRTRTWRRLLPFMGSHLQPVMNGDMALFHMQPMAYLCSFPRWSGSDGNISGSITLGVAEYT